VSDLTDKMIAAATDEIDGTRGAESAERQARAAIAAALRVLSQRNVYLLDYGHLFGRLLAPAGELADEIEATAPSRKD
jgi:hypothetical protein